MASKGAVIARILTEYDAKGTKQARKDLAELQGNFKDFGKKATEAFAAVAAASSAMAIAFGVSAVKAAMAEQQAMAVLNNTLHNTVGANEAVMSSTEAYIKQAALRYNFTTDQVIPSLQSLVVATKDVTKAEGLQKLAMDISANKGKDLNEVSLALAKAYLGNFNALKRMGVPLSESVIKSKDFAAATKELSAAFGGSAAAAADTFAGRVGRIGIAFDMVKKTIGNAIIVALQPFLDKFMGALPKIEAWLDTNSKKIAAFFVTGISYGVAFAQTLYDIFNFVARNIKVFAELGAVIVAVWAGSKVVSGVSALIQGIQTIIKTMKVLREASLAAGFAEAIATGGISAAAGLAAATVAFVGINMALDKFDKNVQNNASKMGDIKFNFKGLTTTAADYLKGLTGVNNATSTNSKLTAEQIKVMAELKKMGVTSSTTTDPIELEAARLNLVKQNNQAATDQFDLMMKNIEAFNNASSSAGRYSDLLSVLSDQTISTSEIETLSAKWGISKEAVVAYIEKVTGVNTMPSDWVDTINAGATGWQKMLDWVDVYIAKLRGIALIPVIPGDNGTGTSGGGSIGGVSTGTNPFPASPLPINTANGVWSPTGLFYPSTPTADFGALATSSAGASGGFSPTVANAMAGNTTIIIQGNVQTKADNVASIRQDLLQGQLSGKSVNFSIANL